MGVRFVTKLHSLDWYWLLRTMDWKTDHNLLAKKIFKRLESDGELSYSDLENIAIEHEIKLNTFDAALAKLHRFKQVKQRTKGDEIYYKAIAKPVKAKKPAKECLFEITLISSPYFGATVCSLRRFKREDDTLYVECAVLTPKFGTNRIWVCPKDIGLPNNDLPLPTEAAEGEIPFPEIDMSMIFLRPAEMLEYKAAAKGIPLHMMKKIHKKK